MHVPGPHYSLPMSNPITNFLTDETFFLTSGDNASCYDPIHYQQIAAICNQPLVYNALFAHRLRGQPYTIQDAKSFLDWAEEGWRHQSHFVFLITRHDGEIVGAIDIKSPDIQCAEIGYWISTEYPGVMTNTVQHLCRIAQQAGYQSLFGLVKPHNIKSWKVLQRAGFEKVDQVQLGEQPFDRYLRTL
jgi:RimJ/RimL family protein N-acetyltransferase